MKAEVRRQKGTHAQIVGLKQERFIPHAAGLGIILFLKWAAYPQRAFFIHTSSLLPSAFLCKKNCCSVAQRLTI